MGAVSTPTSPSTAYEAVIGLEVHSQLLTASKMFCGCSAEYAGAAPNSHVCPVCMGMPGTLPVINKRAVELVLMTGLALNCEIPEASKFDRKNYPYPDLVKGYQISQYDLPFTQHGWVDVEVDGEVRRVGMERVHLEEDTARLVHGTDSDGKAASFVDVNRSGVPLMEIVSKPDIRSAAEARAYLQKLRSIVRALGVSTGNMDEGSFRCDANISLRPVGATEYGTKTEVKNMNSFRAVFRAIEFEIQRQTEVLNRGERVVQETRGWVDDRGITVSQRSKEQAHDYRYFPEPDLPPLFVSREWVSELQAKLPELPDARRERYVSEHGLTAYLAGQLTATAEIGEFFERTLTLYPDPRKVGNWIQTELFRLQKESGDEEGAGKLPAPEHLADLIELVDAGTINQTAAKQVFEEMYRTGRAPSEVVQALGLTQVSDADELTRIVDEVIAANPKPVADYRGGKASAAGRLVGEVMKATRGRANPGVVNALMRERLDAQPG
ncbi:MAG: Asp-tRNA(Asn)/Glu-tRNA(Gln) amidotransferase subunit GatB [Chloroflexi bacterium]|nr:Asp-tRNA(Asn)/Glu-tRNA(Gln) amidotransferase subunit GatB [Chloroflexota bacterium]